MSKKHKHHAPRVEEPKATEPEKVVVLEAEADEEPDVVMEVVATDEAVAETDKVDGLKPAWGTLKEVFATWQKHWKLFTGNALVASIAVMIVSVLAGIGGVAAASSAGAYNPAATAIDIMRGLIANPLLLLGVGVGALLYAAFMLVLSTWMTLAQLVSWRAAHDRDDELTIRTAYAKAWSMVPSYVWISILATILMFVGIVGFIIPGILLALCFAVLPAIAVKEGAKGMTTIRRSVALVSPHLLGVFWRLLFTALVIYLPGAIVGALVGVTFGQDGADLFGQVYDLVVGPIFLGIAYVTYLELKAIETRKEGYNLLRLALICFAVAAALIIGLGISGIL